MRKVIVFGLGIITTLAFGSVMAPAEPSNAERCKHNADICVRNSVKCSDPDKCERRCFYKWDRCDAGLPMPGAGPQKNLYNGPGISGSGPTLQSGIGTAKVGAGGVAAPASISIGNGKSAVGSTLNGGSAVLSQPSVPQQTVPSSGAATHIGGGAQLSTAGGGSIRVKQQ